MGKHKTERIPWYRMPVPLRALPLEDRAAALLEWECTKYEGGRVKKDEDPQVAGGGYSH